MCFGNACVSGMHVLRKSNTTPQNRLTISDNLFQKKESNATIMIIVCVLQHLFLTYPPLFGAAYRIISKSSPPCFGGGSFSNDPSNLFMIMVNMAAALYVSDSGG